MRGGCPIVPKSQNPALASLAGCYPPRPASADQAPPGAEDPDIQGSPACPCRAPGNQAQSAGEKCTVEAKQGKGVKLGGGGRWKLGVGTVGKALPAGGPCSHRGTRDLDLSRSGAAQAPLCPPLGGCKHLRAQALSLPASCPPCGATVTSHLRPPGREEGEHSACLGMGVGNCCQR